MQNGVPNHGARACMEALGERGPFPGYPRALRKPSKKQEIEKSPSSDYIRRRNYRTPPRYISSSPGPRQLSIALLALVEYHLGIGINKCLQLPKAVSDTSLSGGMGNHLRPSIATA